MLDVGSEPTIIWALRSFLFSINSQRHLLVLTCHDLFQVQVRSRAEEIRRKDFHMAGLSSVYEVLSYSVSGRRERKMRAGKSSGSQGQVT